jgi:hypothetical protein
MGRTVRAVVAVALMFLIAVMLSQRLPAPAANGHARRCEIPAEPIRSGSRTDHRVSHDCARRGARRR